MEEWVKANLGDLIHYLRENRPHSAPVMSIVTVANLHDGWAHTKQQKELWQPFGPSATIYCTVHGVVSEEEIFKVEGR